jgi:hypothetical protein
MLLTFGGIELGIGFGQKGALESATRAGARKASTLTADNNLAADTVPAVNAALDSTAVPELRELFIYRKGSAYDASGNIADCSTDCVWFAVKGGDPKHFDTSPSGGNWPATSGRDGCSGTPDRVSVKVHGRFHFLTGLIGSGFIDLVSTSTLQFEPTNCF